jgi:hypothetical protein
MPVLFSELRYVGRLDALRNDLTARPEVGIVIAILLPIALLLFGLLSLIQTVSAIFLLAAYGSWCTGSALLRERKVVPGHLGRCVRSTLYVRLSSTSIHGGTDHPGHHRSGGGHDVPEAEFQTLVPSRYPLGYLLSTEDEEPRLSCF